MKRHLSLDVLRALAVLLVLGYHFEMPDHPLLNAWHRGGYVGVDLFFVLSGFLVSGLLFREYEKTGAIDWRRFLIRRGFKLYPAFWCLIGGTALVRALSGTSQPHQTIAELLFFQNYAGGLWPHTWSIAVEEHFYLALPFFLLAISHDRFRSLPKITTMTMIALFAARFINSTNTFDYRSQLCATHLRFDSLLLGVLLAYWFHFYPSVVKFCSKKAYPLLATGLAALAPPFIWPLEGTPWLISAGVTLQAIGSACLIAALVARGLVENPATRLLGYVGQHSYSIYLWHMPVLLGISALADLEPGLGAVVYAVGAILIGIQLARLIEVPALVIRDRLTV